MESVLWSKIVKENYRVEVEQRYCDTEKDMGSLADDLNVLFEEHRDWGKDTTALVNYDEICRCIFCNEVYETSYDHEREEYVCSYCGKGRLELAVKILAESEGKK